MIQKGSAMLPLSALLKGAFEKFEQDFQPLIYPRVNMLNPLLRLLSDTDWDNLILRTNYKK